MKNSNSAERLKELMNKLDIKQSDMVEKTGIPKSAISMYVSGQRLPRQNRLSTIADAYNVSEAWLMGYDVPMSPTISGKISLSKIASLSNKIRTDENVQTLLNIYYNELSPDNQMRLIEIAKGLSGH